MATELLNLSAYELAKKIEAREVSAREAAEAANARVEEVEGDVNSFVTVTPELAIERAERVDARVRNGGVKPWEGVPIAVKDVLSTRGVRTTCGSKILENFEPLYDASALLNYGEDMIVVGKANCDEFAMGSSTENSAYGVTRNPWDLSRVPGGSSGGSAAAVAAGEGWWALGTDTGGSVRQPAGLCGIVGLKPTYGRVSRYGLIAFASSLDQIGPMTRDVRDSALLLQAIAGHDPHDSTSANVEVPDYLAQLEGGVRGLRVGVVTELMGEGIEPAVREVVEGVVEGLESAGAEVGEVSLPARGMDYRRTTSSRRPRSPRTWPASTGCATASGCRRTGCTRCTARRGRRASGPRRSADHARHLRPLLRLLRRLLRPGPEGPHKDHRGLPQRLRPYDVLVSPTSPSVAFEIGPKQTTRSRCTSRTSAPSRPASRRPGNKRPGRPLRRPPRRVQSWATLHRDQCSSAPARAAEQVADFEFTLKP
jgi:aspartyl-tRNA(Asn)/glutamyl-tRNA(Gln) amidotransferase subunit A